MELDELRELSDAATQGPWDWWQDDTGGGELFVPNGTMDTESVLRFVDHLDCEECGRPSQADAYFIVAAVNYVRQQLAARDGA
jgi:hypothetical protein